MIFLKQLGDFANNPDAFEDADIIKKLEAESEDNPIKN